MALVLLQLFTTLIEIRRDGKMQSVEPDAWWEVNEIFVPDHVEGSNPEMVYDRTVREDHRGFWVAEVQRVVVGAKGTVFSQACTGSGVDDYETTDFIPGNTVTWNWFLGRPCVVPPGEYRIQLTKDMTKPGWPVKQSRDLSNVFTVEPSE